MSRRSGGRAPADVTILSSGHDVADARLHREAAALQRRGLAVEILALGGAGDGPAGATVRTWPRRGPLRRAVHALTLPLRALTPVIVTFDPDVAATSLLWRRLGLRRWVHVSDVHEDYLALLRDRRWARGVRLTAAQAAARAGASASRSADLTVVADQHLLRDAPRRLVLRNEADLSMLPSPSALDPEPRAVYIGDVRDSRGLTAMLEAMRRAPAWTMDVVGPVGTRADREILGRALREPGLRDRVRAHPRMPPRDAWAFAEGAWAGLLMLADTPAFRDALPSKLHEYTACGLPTLASPLPRVVSFLDEVGSGVVVDSAERAAGVLNEWAADPARLQELRDAASAWLAKQPQEPSDLAAFADRIHTLARHGRG